jgi:hypothetical protein
MNPVLSILWYCLVEIEPVQITSEPSEEEEWGHFVELDRD